MTTENSQVKNVLDILLEGTDYKDSLTSQQREKLTGLINETVDARITAKEKLLTEEFSAKETKLKTEIEDVKSKLLKESEENEKVLIEQAESFKVKLEESAIAKVKEFKEVAEKAYAEKASLYRQEIEQIALTEAKAYKDKKDSAATEEVKKFKGDLIEKVSSYLEAKIEKAIPSDSLNAAAKLAVYEPLVQSLMEGFSKHFIKLDDTSYELIKESKSKIAVLESELQTTKKEIVRVSKEKNEVERNLKIKTLTEGLTQAQSTKARKLLEGFELTELEPRFKKIRDIVIESEVKSVTPEVKKSVATAEVLTEGKKTEQTTPAPTAVKVQQEKAIAEMQKKEEIKPKEQKAQINEGDQHVQKWASKINPRYLNG